MPRPSFRAALTALAILFLFAAIAPRAEGTSFQPPAVTRATIDRVEDEWLVLDVPPHPSLPMPAEMAAWAREGGRGDRHGSARAAERDRRAIRLGSLGVAGRRRRARPAAPLRSGDAGSTEFRWPADLAPAVRAGEALDFQVEPNPAR